MKKTNAAKILLAGLLCGCQSLRGAQHVSDEQTKETKAAWAGLAPANSPGEGQLAAKDKTTAKSKWWPHSKKSDEVAVDVKSTDAKTTTAKSLASKETPEAIKKVAYQRDPKVKEPNKISNATAQVLESKTVDSKPQSSTGEDKKTELSPPPAIVEVSKPEGEIIAEGSDRPVRLLRPYGVDQDQPGLSDNFTWRLGATYVDDNADTAVGFGATSEFSSQIGSSSFFWHAGGGVELRDGVPATGSIGFSKLAKIENGKVTQPLILGISYDGLYEQDFRIADQSAYFDGARFLAGWAVRPWMDIGAWGMVNLNSDSVQQTVGATTTRFNGQFRDRVAGYVAMDFGNRGSRVLGSIGKELDNSSTFYELDYSRPLFNHTSFFVSAGYSDRNGGLVDGFAGVEVNLGKLYSRISGRDRKWNRGEGADGCDPCGEVCDPCACDVAYRGGWAYDNYRSALRVLTPGRAQRYLGVTQQVNNVVIPQEIPPKETPDPQEKPPVVTPTPEDCVPKYDFGVKNESRLSKFLDGLGNH